MQEMHWGILVCCMGPEILPTCRKPLTVSHFSIPTGLSQRYLSSSDEIQGKGGQNQGRCFLHDSGGDGLLEIGISCQMTALATFD